MTTSETHHLHGSVPRLGTVVMKFGGTSVGDAQRIRSVAELELTEGKNREVRRLFESQGLTVKRLQRLQIGKIKLGELKPGKWRTLTEPEIKSLLG